jgi:hypothetical protein
LRAPQHGDHLGERQIAAVLKSERSGNVMRSDGSIGNVNDSLSLRQYDLLHLSSRHDFGSDLRLMPDPQAGAYSSLSLSTTITKSVKKAIAANVAGLFNDRSHGEKPVVMRQTDGLFGPAAVARRVHGDVTSMMVGGIAGLLLQMLHPAVLAGVWDHSNFRSDMQGRLRRTARFIHLPPTASSQKRRRLSHAYEASTPA